MGYEVRTRGTWRGLWAKKFSPRRFKGLAWGSRATGFWRMSCAGEPKYLGKAAGNTSVKPQKHACFQAGLCTELAAYLRDEDEAVDRSRTHKDAPGGETKQQVVPSAEETVN